MSKRIRILYTIPNFNTAGSGRSVYDLVKHLDRTVFEPEICCFHDRGVFFKDVEALGVKIHIFPFTTSYRPWIGFLTRVLKIRNFFKTHQIDVIHSWHWSSDISEPLAAKLAGIPYVYTKKAMGWGNRYWKWRSQLSSKVIVVNEDMVSAYFSKMLNRIVQFPLAIDVNKFLPIQASESLKKELDILPNDFVIISVANLVPVKGIETLLDAVEQLKDNNLKVLIVGNDTNSYGEEMKTRYKNNSNIQFLGKQMDVKPYLALADLFVIPTKDEGRKEGIPNAPLEAMAMGKLVLGSHISGIYDILKPFPEFMFHADDVIGLSQKIKEIQTMDLLKRQQLEVAMRHRVIDVFSIDSFLKSHESLYLELVKKA